MSEKVWARGAWHDEYPAPFSVEIEPTYGCQLRCKMCGLQGTDLGRGEYRFMEPSRARGIAKAVHAMTRSPRIEICGHGDPLLNPLWQQVVAPFADLFPRSSVNLTTNGLALRDDPERTLFALHALVNVLVVDLYQPYGVKLKETLAAAARGWRLHNYEDGGFNPWANNGPRVKVIVFLDDLLTYQGKARFISNAAGNSGFKEPLAAPYTKTCNFPMTHMLIHYDGRVGLCCEDWKRECDLGQVPESSAAEVWRGERAMAARRLLAAKQRVFAPCSRCDVKPWRVGLLPKLEPPTLADHEAVESTEFKRMNDRLDILRANYGKGR